MKPAPFQYIPVASIDEALEQLAEHGFDAKLLAGGQSLIPAMNFRMAQPAVLIDLNRIPDLSYITPTESGGLLIGAMTRHAEVERNALVAERLPLLHATMPHIAHPQIRNRGTLGGSLVHADPAAELPAIALALKATLHVRGKTGARTIPADSFFLGMFTTALEPEELLEAVEWPVLPPRSGWDFQEMARRHGDFALAGVAATVTLDEAGACTEARLVFLSVGEGPVDAHEAAAALEGAAPTPEAIAAAAEAAVRTLDPPGDIHASADFRRHLARVLARRALQAAFVRAGSTLDAT